MSYKIKILSLAMFGTYACQADTPDVKSKDTPSTGKASQKAESKNAAEKSNPWLTSVENRVIKARSAEIAAQETTNATSSKIVKIEELYEAYFKKTFSWPNTLRKGGQGIKFGTRAVVAAFIIYGMTQSQVTSRISLASYLDAPLLAALFGILAFKILEWPIEKIAQLVQWDPRAEAFANKVLECIDSGETIISDQKVVQDATDNALATNGRSTKIIPLQDRVSKSEKLALAKKISAAIKLAEQN